MRVKPTCLPLALLLGLALLTAGCSTFQGRATERAAVFGALDPATQARLKEGLIQLGDTMDMAYIAVGEPDEKHDQLSAEGHAVVWIYHIYWQDYVGEDLVGYHRIHPASGSPPVVAPVTHSMYQGHEEEYLRLTFKEGKVSVIERPKG
jgi:hypothetical protein